jgi:hypothetical protein
MQPVSWQPQHEIEAGNQRLQGVWESLGKGNPNPGPSNVQRHSSMSLLSIHREVSERNRMKNKDAKSHHFDQNG